MKNTFFAAAVSLVAVLAGCSVFGPSKISNVMQIGKDSYTVRAMSPRSVSEAKQNALVAGNAYCKQQGNKNVMLVKEFGGLEGDTNEKFYDLTFMCLMQNDKDFSRIRKAADLNATDVTAPTEQNQ